MVLTDQRTGLEGADVGWASRADQAALVGGDAADGGARADGRAAGQQGHGLGRPAVVAQRGQAQAVEAGQDDVAVGRRVIPPEPPVPIRLYVPVTSPARSAMSLGSPVAGVAGDDRVGERRSRRRVSRRTAAATAVAELPLIVQAVRVSVAVVADSSARPPPSVAELPLIVQSVSVAVPVITLSTPAAVTAMLPLIVQP